MKYVSASMGDDEDEFWAAYFLADAVVFAWWNDQEERPHVDLIPRKTLKEFAVLNAPNRTSSNWEIEGKLLLELTYPNFEFTVPGPDPSANQDDAVALLLPSLVNDLHAS